MVEVRMLARSVGTANGRSVVQLVSVADPNDDNEAEGQATITVNDAEELGAFVEGKVYWLEFSEADAADAGPHAAALATIQEAAAIPNSTNTPGYVTPPELKVVPQPVPDGVVTQSRPSVVMAPAEGSAPATAGVMSGPQANVAPGQVATPTAPTEPAAPTTPGKSGDKK